MLHIVVNWGYISNDRSKQDVEVEIKYDTQITSKGVSLDFVGMGDKALLRNEWAIEQRQVFLHP